MALEKQNASRRLEDPTSAEADSSHTLLRTAQDEPARAEAERLSSEQQISTGTDSSHTLPPTAQDEPARAEAERPSSKQQKTALVEPPKETTRYVNSLLIL